MKMSKQDGWTLIVTSDNDMEFKYQGIKELRNGELPIASDDQEHGPILVVLVQDEDSWQLWAVREWIVGLQKLEAYLDTWEPQVKRFLVCSPIELRLIAAREELA